MLVDQYLQHELTITFNAVIFPFKDVWYCHLVAFRSCKSLEDIKLSFTFFSHFIEQAGKFRLCSQQ